MANLVSYTTTVGELQNFLQTTTLSATEKLIVIFDHEIQDFNRAKNSKKLDTETTITDVAQRPFHDFTKDEFLGAWVDRQDIGDSTAYVKKLRNEQWG